LWVVVDVVDGCECLQPAGCRRRNFHNYPTTYKPPIPQPLSRTACCGLAVMPCCCGAAVVGSSPWHCFIGCNLDKFVVMAVLLFWLRLASPGMGGRPFDVFGADVYGCMAVCGCGWLYEAVMRAAVWMCVAVLLYELCLCVSGCMGALVVCLHGCVWLHTHGPTVIHSHGYGCVWLCMAVWLYCRTVTHWLCMLCMVLYGSVWLCGYMAVDGCGWLCVAVCGCG